MPYLIADVVPAGTLSGATQPTLLASGLVLRPWRASDAADVEAVVTAYADPAIQQWHCRTMSPSEAADWLAAWPGRWRTESGAGWAVTSPAGEVVGQIGLRTVELPAGLAEVSYWVLPVHRGQHIAPRALAALTEWALGPLGLHRLELRHATVNEASCRVATSAGYAAEGVQRSALLHPDGWHDMHLHAAVAV